MSTKTEILSAIDAKCRDCTYDPYDLGTWQQQVRLCSSANCALHPYRYGQPDRKGGRVLTDEQKRLAGERLRSYRNSSQPQSDETIDNDDEQT